MYDPSPEQRRNIPIGAQGYAKVIGWAADDRGQAVWVRSLPRSSNKHPHITVATNGTPPVYSNELLARSVTFIEGPELHGIVDIRRD